VRGDSRLEEYASDITVPRAYFMMGGQPGQLLRIAANRVYAESYGKGQALLSISRRESGRCQACLERAGSSLPQCVRLSI